MTTRTHFVTGAVASIALCLLASCSGEQQKAAPKPQDAQLTAQKSGVSSGSATKALPPASVSKGMAGETMNADVSGLSGDISDLSVRVTATATIVDLPADILFAFDQATPSAGAQGPLQKLLGYVRAGASGTVTVTGYTDAKGEDAYNLALSQKRAQAVADWLKGQGVAVGRLTVVGKGEADPIAPNAKADGSDDPDGRAKNRRVSVTIPR